MKCLFLTMLIGKHLPTINLSTASSTSSCFGLDSLPRFLLPKRAWIVGWVRFFDTTLLLTLLLLSSLCSCSIWNKRLVVLPGKQRQTNEKNIKVKGYVTVAKSKMLVLMERSQSCHMKYTCDIRKPYFTSKGSKVMINVQDVCHRQFKN